MINGETMTVLIVLIAIVAGLISRQMKHRHERDLRVDEVEGTEAGQLRREVQQLRDRDQVLERVITDNRRAGDLDDEIARLRDR